VDGAKIAKILTRPIAAESARVGVGELLVAGGAVRVVLVTEAAALVTLTRAVIRFSDEARTPNHEARLRSKHTMMKSGVQLCAWSSRCYHSPKGRNPKMSFFWCFVNDEFKA